MSGGSSASWATIPSVTPLVLAAGASQRMGRPKATLPLGETTALGRILAHWRQARLDRAIVVTGADPAAVQSAVNAAVSRAGLPNPWLVENDDWALGRTTSIQAGLRRLPERAEAFLLWPVDIPLPGLPMLEALLEARAASLQAPAWGQSAAPRPLAWVPSHGGRRGHPVLIDRELVPAFLELGPDQPAREVIHRLDSEAQLVHVEVEDEGVLFDLNTLDDWEAARARVE